MNRSASPPTERALDIVELLAKRHRGVLRLADIARELDLSQSTAHAIITTLCERGWASRDPIDKTLSLGPALEVAAARADAARPRAHAARGAAVELAGELGYESSVTERTGEHLTLIFFGGGPAEVAPLSAGERIPFGAPFGPAFAAWTDDTDRDQWIDRGSRGKPDLARRLSDYLDATRARGYSIEHMAPTLARTARLLERLGEDPWSTTVRQVIDDALVEITTAGFVTGHESVATAADVTAISAPIFDRHGRVVLNIAVHPFDPLPADEIAEIGSRLVRATRAISEP